jgi:hypothetical protein
MADQQDTIIIRRPNAELPVPKKLAGSLGMLDAFRLALALISVVRKR